MKSNTICHLGFTTNTLRTWRINFYFIDFLMETQVHHKKTQGNKVLKVNQLNN